MNVFVGSPISINITSNDKPSVAVDHVVILNNNCATNVKNLTVTPTGQLTGTSIKAGTCTLTYTLFSTDGTNATATVTITSTERACDTTAAGMPQFINNAVGVNWVLDIAVGGIGLNAGTDGFAGKTIVGLDDSSWSARVGQYFPVAADQTGARAKRFTPTTYLPAPNIVWMIEFTESKIDHPAAPDGTWYYDQLLKLMKSGPIPFYLELKDAAGAISHRTICVDMANWALWHTGYGGVRGGTTPIALDLNRDGKIGVTGNSTAKGSTGPLGRTVQFDIDGNGTIDTTEWFAGDGDGILVDNRDHNAAMTMSGKRLFGDEGGKYTNGYTKLAKLDRNHDGQLTGTELNGLAVWIDNGDAKVQPGELNTTRSLNITAIKTTMTLNNGLMQSTATIAGHTTLTEDVWFKTTN